MKYLNDLYLRYAGIIWSLFSLLVFIVATLVLICSCRSVKYVPVETTRDIYHNTTDTLRDSIYHDVFIDRYIKNDTVFINKTEYLYKDKWRNHTDTLIRTDSVQVPFPVEKNLTAWQQFKQDNYITSMLIALLLLLLLLGYIIIRSKLKQ